RLASDISADLVVVGTASRGGGGRLVFGSGAAKDGRPAPCPVLVVRPQEIPMWGGIGPPWPDCTHVAPSAKREHLWCARHSQHHPRWHTYHEAPASFGVGTMTFRD